MPAGPARAATILGASPRQIFWQVVPLMLKLVIVVAFVIRSMETIKLFDEVFMLTRGGPGSSTETISLYIYKLCFQRFPTRLRCRCGLFGAGSATLIFIHLLPAPVRDQLLETRH